MTFYDKDNKHNNYSETGEEDCRSHRRSQQDEGFDPPVFVAEREIGPADTARVAGQVSQDESARVNILEEQPLAAPHIGLV